MSKSIILFLTIRIWIIIKKGIECFRKEKREIEMKTKIENKRMNGGSNLVTLEKEISGKMSLLLIRTQKAALYYIVESY